MILCKRVPWIFLYFAYASTMLASSTLSVDEAKTRLQVGTIDSILKLAVRGSGNEEQAAHIELELLNPNDQVVHSVSHDSVLKSGFNVLEIPLGTFFSRPNSRLENDFLWYRLRYRLK